MSAKRVWIIEGYDSTNRIFQRRVSGTLTSAEITAMLQRLASRHLAPEEIVSGSLRRNRRERTSLLDAAMDGGVSKSFTVRVGENPFYAARRIEE